MIGTLAISIASCLLMASSAIFFPNVNVKGHHFPLYCLFPLLGAIVLLASGLVDAGHLVDLFTSNSPVNPLQILLLFFSMVFVSTMLDEEGFFAYLAKKALSHSGSSQYGLFTLLFAFVSILTVFTSNDIIVLTFTPFLILFCRHAKIDPIPYLLCEFIAANTFSAFLPVGNPTNIFLTQALEISWADYLLSMSLPSLAAGLVAYLVLLLLFSKKLKKKIEVKEEDDACIEDKVSLAVCIAALSLCILSCALSSFLPLPSYLCCLIVAIALLFFSLIKGGLRHSVRKPLSALSRLPYSLLPLLLGMFVIVFSLKEEGITEAVGRFLSGEYGIWSYGATSLFAANLTNNIPMSVLYEEIFLSVPYDEFEVYAVILSSNLAAYLTPFGALAGLIFISKCHSEDVPLSFSKFCLYGIITAIPCLIAGLGVLQIESLLMR